MAGLALPQWLHCTLATRRNPRQRGQTPSVNLEMLSRVRSFARGGAANQLSRALIHLKRMADPTSGHLLGVSVSVPMPLIPTVVHWPFSVPSGWTS